jgi:hypothetical protein
VAPQPRARAVGRARSAEGRCSCPKAPLSSRTCGGRGASTSAREPVAEGWAASSESSRRTSSTKRSASSRRTKVSTASPSWVDGESISETTA